MIVGGNSITSYLGRKILYKGQKSVIIGVNTKMEHFLILEQNGPRFDTDILELVGQNKTILVKNYEKYWLQRVGYVNRHQFKLLEKKYPNTKLFRSLYPEAKVVDNTLEVEC